MTGPLGYGSQQFLPLGVPLPYTIDFENSATASSTAGEVRIVTKLDPSLDPTSFRLGDIRIGDIQVHVPAGIGSFQGDFDFTTSKGFILRVSAGLDLGSDTATWLLQAIDPDTGEVIRDPNMGLLPPNNAAGSGSGFVSYTILPLNGVATGTTISASARVLLNTAPPMDTAPLQQTIDGLAPTTTLSANPVVQGSADYQVQWTAQDDPGGSGVQHVTVYVAEDGGDYTIWLNQTNETSAVYQGLPGHTYQFLALATDNAGNREQPPAGFSAPDDGSQVNVGALPTVPDTTPTDLGPAPGAEHDPVDQPTVRRGPAADPRSGISQHPSEFQTVLRPFTAQAFATGIAQSHAQIGPLAIAVLADGSVLASGGPGRNQLFHFPADGGQAGVPLATLPVPIYDLALDAQGSLWAATGGGPLLQLDPQTGAILGQFGDGLTQALAIQPGTGLIFVSSGKGIETFDPVTSQFHHFSNVRVGSLAFAPDGSLWAATWPNQGKVIRFDHLAKPQVMLSFDTPVGSIAFGAAGTPLDGLLFVANNGGAQPGQAAELILVDLRHASVRCSRDRRDTRSDRPHRRPTAASFSARPTRSTF